MSNQNHVTTLPMGMMPESGPTHEHGLNGSNDKRPITALVLGYLQDHSGEWCDALVIADWLVLNGAQTASACSRGYTATLPGWEHVERSARRPYVYRYDANITRLDDGATEVNVPTLTIIGELPSGVLLCKHDNGIIYAASPAEDVVVMGGRMGRA